MLARSLKTVVAAAMVKAMAPEAVNQYVLGVQPYTARLYIFRKGTSWLISHSLSICFGGTFQMQGPSVLRCIVCLFIAHFDTETLSCHKMCH